MPAILGHWVVATEVARHFLGSPRYSEYFDYFQGDDGDRHCVHLLVQRPDSKPWQYEIEVSTYFFLGSNGPDVPYAYHVTIPEAAVSKLGADSVRPGLSDVADLFHYNKPSEYVLELVRLARGLRSSEPQRAKRLLSYALGHATHIIVDAIIHPYVNCFAGAYHDQTMPEIHRTCELHQDSWLAQSYFGRASIHEGPSWLEFLPEPDMLGQRGEVAELCDDLAKAFGKTYGEKSAVDVKGHYFLESYRNFYQSFVGDYVGQVRALETVHIYVPGEPHLSLVFHQPLAAQNVYYANLIRKHAIPEAIDACQTVMDLYDAPDFSESAQNTFRSKLKNFNLDVGYWIDIELVGNRLSIIWRHTWAKRNLSGSPRGWDE